MRRVCIAFVALGVALATGCGERISLGEADRVEQGDGGGAADAADDRGPSDLDAGALDGGALDGGPAPDSGTTEDGGAAYDPCAGKACGDRCVLCAPWDNGCVETAVVKECNGAAQCVTSPAACP